MTIEQKVEIGEQVGEVLLGLAAGVAHARIVLPKLETKVEKTVVTLGTIPVWWMLGRHWAKTYYKFCDGVLGTNHKYIINNL